ncbi:M48 family metallopeptidase [Winogradskyella psychrotolerans]|uniref:M48 family metallopeptidase n=1 Tax=Winogradskyella damuponensis TaxID=943939 RepID=A0ABP8CVW0_9FLAO|nr:M48 family metallopeptidase [Winogradskyella psychrotolerans]MBU2921425.1 M48 family metallopeptidase [Winogradskyella psychrotolerans]
MKFNKLVLGIAIVAFVASCATNPFTGKKTLAFVGNDQLFPSSFAQYNQVLSDSKVITGTEDADMITRVGQRIAIASERWLTANGNHGYLDDYKWEYKLIESEQVNAWCMPGGKIAFYTGILPIAANETGIAAIMAHEVAHALANHGQQRMSASYIQQGLAVAGNVALSNDEQALGIFNQSYGVVSNVAGMLPFSRAHETEADEIGLYLMAIAGYNPDEASVLWERMKANSGGEAPPEFMSTHPSNDSRIKNLRELAPKAKAEAKKFGITSFRPIN